MVWREFTFTFLWPFFQSSVVQRWKKGRQTFCSQLPNASFSWPQPFPVSTSAPSQQDTNQHSGCKPCSQLPALAQAHRHCCPAACSASAGFPWTSPELRILKAIFKGVMNHFFLEADVWHGPCKAGCLSNGLPHNIPEQCLLSITGSSRCSSTLD